jgi:homospermidine synthase
MINFGSINTGDEPYVTIWRSINDGTAEKVLAGDTAGNRTPINSMAINIDTVATIGLPFGGVDTLPETWETGQTVKYGIYMGHNDSAAQTVRVNIDLTNTNDARYTRPMSYFTVTEYAS